MTNCPICGGVQGPHNSVLPGCECSYRMKLNHHPSLMWQMMKLDDEWKARLEAAVLAEREACAVVAEKLGVHPALNVYNGGPDWYKHGKEIAAKIRARGQE